MNLYFCTIYNHDYTTGDQEALLGSECAPATRLGSISVRARCRRKAAARAYVRTAGQVRVRKLLELNVPACCIIPESSLRRMARSLDRTCNWLGDCFFFDTMVEVFYIRIERLPAPPQPAGGRQARRRLLRGLQFPSSN